MPIQILTEDDLQPADETPGVTRELAFQTEDVVMVRSRVAGGTATDWHHHGDRHVYGYLLEGEAAVEYGPDGADRLEGRAPGFFHVPPGVVHRDLNPSEGDQVSVITFVGDGPLVVNVDEPRRD